MVALIVAHSANRVIGRDGGIPWRLPTDLRRFRELTTGHAVVMGRKTFESLPPAFRPLPDRRNIVLTRDASLRLDGAETFSGLDVALEACGGECFVIGGGRVYADALPLATRVYATHVEADFEGDTWFPELPEHEWRRVEESDPVTENGHTFTFRVYERER